jgi:hypothetical protein
MRYDDIDVELNQLASECSGAITLAFRVTPFDRDVLALDIIANLVGRLRRMDAGGVADTNTPTRGICSVF